MVTTQFMKHFWCARLLLAFIPRRYGFVPHRQQVQISRHLFHLLKGSIGGGAADLVEQVKDLMSRSPYIESRICIADDINYSCDLLSFTGGDNYTSLQAQWYRSVLPRLSSPQFTITRLAALSDNKVIINWNVSFVAEPTVPLVSTLGSLPGVRLRFFDILDKERIRSSFSWRALGRTLGNLVNTGELVLPHAVILGTSEMTFARESSGLMLVKQQDSLKLMRSLDAGVLKNRKLTLDLLEFLDAWRPSFIGFNEWTELVSRRVDVRGVPGMGQFDVDGLEGTQQENINTVVVNLLRIAGPLLVILLLFSRFVLDVQFFAPDDSPAYGYQY